MKRDTNMNAPAFVEMAMDILGNVLSRADNPANLGTYLTEEVRDLTGARCVLLVQCLCTEAVTVHRAINVNPLRRREWAESPAVNRLYEITHHLSAPQLWHGEEPAEVAGLLRQEGFELSMVFPLHAGEFRVGAMLVLGLPDEAHITSVLSLLGNLSTIVALVVRNEFFYEKQEQVIQEREDDLRRLTLFQRTILDNVAYGIVSTTPEGIVTSFNPAVERLLGYTADEMVGKQTPACWHDPEEVTRHALRLSAELGETITPGFEVFAARARRNLPEENEWTFICKDGRRIPINLSITALRDEGGHITGFVGMGYDISERKLAEEKLARLNAELEQRVAERTASLQQKTGELEQANERLKEVDRLKSSFIASMSHELRTPLNSVIGFSTVMLDEWTGPVNAEQKQNLATILGAGRHLLDMINDILDVTQIEAGTIAPVIEEFDLHDLLDEAVSEVAATIREKGLELRYEPLRQAMRTDRRRLLQCVRNMLSNAAKFTDTGRVSLEVRILPSPGETPAENLVGIVVADTGIGIGEADRSRIFDPFHRIVIPERVIVPGTGLGLFLTRKITTDILKGDIDVSSTYGTGSRFSLRIPVRLP